MVDSTKIKFIYDWVRPIYLNKISSFIRLAGYYWKFIERFATITIND